MDMVTRIQQETMHNKTYPGLKILGHSFVSTLCEASLNKGEVLFLLANLAWITTNERYRSSLSKCKKAKSTIMSPLNLLDTRRLCSPDTTSLLFNGKQSKQQQTRLSTFQLFKH